MQVSQLLQAASAASTPPLWAEGSPVPAQSLSSLSNLINDDNGATPSPTRMFGRTAPLSPAALQFSASTARIASITNLENELSPQGTSHDPGSPSGSEHTLELALAELLAQDRRDSLTVTNSHSRPKQKRKTKLPPREFHEIDMIPDPESAPESEGEYSEFKSPPIKKQKAVRGKGSRASMEEEWPVATNSSRSAVTPTYSGATTGRHRNSAPIIIEDPIAVPKRASTAGTKRVKRPTNINIPPIQDDVASVLSSLLVAPTPIRPVAVPAARRAPILGPIVKSFRAEIVHFDNYTPGEGSSSDEEVYESKQRRKGKGRAMRETTEKARIADDDDDEHDDRLYCLCRRLYDPNRFMVACDKCEEWYHPECIMIPEAHVDLLDEVVCPSCENSTDDRTTWKQRCARPTCLSSVAPLSKYCSDYCGIEVAATRLDLANIHPEAFWPAVAGARRREGAVVLLHTAKLVDPPTESDKSQAQPKTPLASIDDSRQLQILTDARALQLLELKLSELTPQRDSLESKIAAIVARIHFLTIVSNRWEVICNAAARTLALENSKSKSKAKPVKRGGNSKVANPTAAPDAPCGFDARLVLDDDEWSEWISSEEGIKILAGDGRARITTPDDSDEAVMDFEGVCLTARKRCDRHTGWTKIREADFKVENAVLQRRLARLATQEERIREQIREQEETGRFRLANDGKVGKVLEPQDLAPIDVKPIVNFDEVPALLDFSALPSLPDSMDVSGAEDECI